FTIRPYLLCTYMTCTPRLPARRPSMSVSLLYKIMCHSSQNDLDRSISYQLSLCQRTGPSSPMVSSPAGAGHHTVGDWRCGATGIRTPDVLLAKQVLWPAEL